MPKTILVGLHERHYRPEHLEKLRSLAPDYEVVATRNRQEVVAMLDDIEVAAGELPRELIPPARNLRWMQLWFAGADWILDYPEIQAKAFIVTNASGLHAIPITEHIFALLLAFARDIHGSVRAQGQKRWLSHGQGDVFELADKILLIIGVGAIGSRTAAIANALGMRVLGVRRNPARPVPHVAAMFGPEQLLEALPQADFVVLTIPATPETTKLIGPAELEAMKSSAYIVNTGRGDTIDQRALIQALQRGQLAGAGLDVFETEPLPPDSPLWEMDNVIITAHYAGQTPHYNERAWEIFYDNLGRYLAGESLRNVVDTELGY